MGINIGSHNLNTKSIEPYLRFDKRYGSYFDFSEIINNDMNYIDKININENIVCDNNTVSGCEKNESVSNPTNNISYSDYITIYYKEILFMKIMYGNSL